MRLGLSLSPRHGGLALAAVVLAADRLTKLWVLQELAAAPAPTPVTSFFNLVLVYNKGVSFGLLSSIPSDLMPWLLSFFALAITAVLVAWLWRTHDRALTLGLGLVIGGALGNVLDRVLYGAVVDFLDFHAFGWHWPAFNLADTAISLGVAIILFDSLFRRA